jgi:hypothetical protein
VYLSIDLDYWFMSNVEDVTGADLFLQKVFALKKPIFVTTYHDGLLKDLNKKHIDKIIHVDFHSDLATEPISKKELNEGTFLNFYKWRKSCIYEWRYPDTEICFTIGNGRCDWHNFDDEKNKPIEKWDPSKMGYKEVKRKKGLKGINLKKVDWIGISLSPNWCQPSVQKIYDKYFNGFDYNKI